MKNIPLSRPLALVLAPSAGLLAACGGGNDETPTPTPISASVGVTNATFLAFNGGYATSNISLTGVERAETLSVGTVCAFRFSGVQQAGSTRLMSGDVRYNTNSNQLRTTFITIDGVEFVLNGTAGAVVNLAANRVEFTGAVFTGSGGSNGTITLTGPIPMRSPRPNDC